MDGAALFQRNMKENSDDLREFLDDIKSWEDEIKKKDELLSKQKPILKKAFPPIRNKSNNSKVEKVKTSKVGEGSTRINSYDYRAWDKFDVERACEDSDGGGTSDSSEHEEEDEAIEEYTQEQNQQKAVIEKEKGNVLFSQHKYEAAIERYTQAVALDPTNAVLPANRAMALLKMNRFAAAEQDCTVALAIDPTYTKALFRRATARVNLKKYHDATHDFNELLKLEPDNKKAKAELVRISSLRTSVSEAKEAQPGLVYPITRPSYMRSKKPLKTVLIEEIGLETSLAMTKGPTATIKDETSTAVQYGRRVESCEDAPTAGKSFSTTTEDTSTTVKTVSSTTLSTLKDLPSTAGMSDSCIVKETSSTVKDLVEDASVNSNDSTVRTFVHQLPAVPTTSVMFIHEWKRLQAKPDLQSDYFQLLPVDRYSSILSQSLETDVFPDIIHILYNSYVKCGRSCMKELQALTKVQRFSVALMFLSSKDKTRLHDLFSELQPLTGSEDKPLLQQLARTYKVSL